MQNRALNTKIKSNEFAYRPEFAHFLRSKKVYLNTNISESGWPIPKYFSLN